MPSFSPSSKPVSPSEQISCWVVTDGKIGMENQCVGLAEALGLQPTIKRVQMRFPWRQLAPYLRLGKRFAYRAPGDLIEPPWPDLVIATGRASILASLRARRAGQKRARPTVTVQLQDPVIDPARFDLVVVPRHDALLGANVLTTRGGLHRLTPAKLAADAAQFAPLWAQLPRPHIGVILGGSNAVYDFSANVARQLAVQLARLAHDTGGSLLITPSRRTGTELTQIFQTTLASTPHYLWDMQSPNPYYGLLGAADALIVTADSVNMVSEAATTGKPVLVAELPGGSEKFRRFHQTMRDDGFVRPFRGQLEHWQYQPLDDVGTTAARVRDLMQSRGYVLPAHR